MLASAQGLIKKVATQMGLDHSEIDFLLRAEKEHVFEIKLSSGTKHQAYRVQHNSTLGPYKGGVRFHPDVNLDEVRALATLMSLKTAAAGLPLGGGKGGVSVDPKNLSKDDLEELSRAYARHLIPHIGPDKDVPAPDVNTTAEIIDWMVDEFARETGDKTRASFTGKSVGKGGSLGREAATGRGGVIALSQALKSLDMSQKKLTYAVQGFGNVGLFFATIAETVLPNLILQAATDSRGGISSGFGLSAEDLASYKQAGNAIGTYGDEDVIQIDNQDILGEEVDILVLAALGDVIDETNMKSVRAKVILELANGPINEKAYDYLCKQGVVIVPDVLANAGGVIVSYLEWLQNRADESWSEKKVNDELDRYMKQAMKAALRYAKQHNVTLKEAAFSLAIERILEARKGNS